MTSERTPREGQTVSEDSPLIPRREGDATTTTSTTTTAPPPTTAAAGAAGLVTDDAANADEDTNG